MLEMYTTHAHAYGEAIKDNIFNALLERPSSLAMLDALKGKRVLDLGCGPGLYVQHFLEQGADEVRCIDASAQMVEQVKAQLGAQVQAYVQDLAQGLPCEQSNSMDVVIAPLLIHYIENLNPLFKDIARVLKSNGYFVFSTHHPVVDFEASPSGNYFAREWISEEWDTIGTPVQVGFYRRSLSELVNALSEAGLLITRLSEGEVSEEVKMRDPALYQRLKTTPNFLFLRCEKR